MIPLNCLARAGTGLAIKTGAPRPDISTDEKLKAFLLGVKSITHGDPAQGGFSTVYFVKTASTLGIAETLKAKTKFTPAGEGAVPVAKGESELGVGLMSEIIPVAGVQGALSHFLFSACRRNVRPSHGAGA